MSTKLKHIVVTGVAVTLGFGSVLMPVAYAATQAANTTVNALIGSAISISTTSPVNLNITPTASGSATSSKDTVTVSTNNATGYTLTLADNDTNRNMVSGSNNIVPTSGTLGTPAVMDSNSWGFRIDSGAFGAGPTVAQSNVASLTGTWAGVPASGSPVTLKSTGTTAVNDVTSVWYGAFVNSSVPNGTYTDIVTYTAATN